jgi:hypothetical protein
MFQSYRLFAPVEMLASDEVPVLVVTVPESAGVVPVYDHSLDEFHSPKRKSGFVVFPEFARTYFRCSPLGPSTGLDTSVVPLLDGTPVTLNKGFPVAASNARAKLLVNRIAGDTPCWLGSSRSYM